ncbi:hypothetical protein ACA910_012999 [Epithemia clementina (nom. ined.)]
MSAFYEDHDDELDMESVHSVDSEEPEPFHDEKSARAENQSAAEFIDGAEPAVFSRLSDYYSMPPNSFRRASITSTIRSSRASAIHKIQSASTYAASYNAEQQHQQQENLHSITIISEPDKHNSRRSCIKLAAIVALMVLTGGALAGLLVLKQKSANQAARTPAPTTQAPTLAPTPAPTTRQPTPFPTTKAPVLTPSPTTEIFHFLKPRLPDSGLSLLFRDSYQTKAIEWTQKTFLPEEHDEQRVIQRFVLACIHYATNQVASPYTRYTFGQDGVFSGWFESQGWLEEPNECLWYGITCNKDGQVEEIDLSENLLTGTFPAETSLLKTSLTRLILHNNLVYNYGEFGNAWLGELTKLKELDLSGTAFQYVGIPGYIGQLENLEVLDVSYSLYFGPLQEETFQNLTHLQYLDIGGNSYNSSLPESIGNLTNLVYFYADDCDLEGDLSVWATPEQLPALYELWIDNNPMMTGTLPSELGQYSNLTSISLTGLGITGKIPTQLGNLRGLEQLWLVDNKLNGKIPSQFGSLTKLTILELESNDLSGSMPKEICKAVQQTRVLDVLEADCGDDKSKAKVQCDYPNCCTCCGSKCIDNDPRPLSSIPAVVVQSAEREPPSTTTTTATEEQAGGNGRRRNLWSENRTTGSTRHSTSTTTTEDRHTLRHRQRQERVRRLKDPYHAELAAKVKKENLEFHPENQNFLS